MKNCKLTVPGLFLLVLAVSCNKKDLYSENPAPEFPTQSSIVVPKDTTVWQSVSQWQSIKQDKISILYSSISDKRITSEVVLDGLVLVFKKEGGTTVALPFEEKNDNGSAYWYHQLTEGNLLILSDVHNTSKVPATKSCFKYIIVTPEKLKNLEEQGYTRSNLLDLSYDQTTQLLSFQD